jgi:hypothetical protein
MDTAFLEEHSVDIENGIIKDPGLNMFKDANWNLREPNLKTKDKGPQ